MGLAARMLRHAGTDGHAEGGGGMATVAARVSGSSYFLEELAGLSGRGLFTPNWGIFDMNLRHAGDCGYEFKAIEGLWI